MRTGRVSLAVSMIILGVALAPCGAAFCQAASDPADAAVPATGPGAPAADAAAADTAPAVINTAVAVVASLQSTEVFKLLIDSGTCNRDLLTLDLWDMTFCSVKVDRDPSCPVCGSELPQLT